MERSNTIIESWLKQMRASYENNYYTRMNLGKQSYFKTLQTGLGGKHLIGPIYNSIVLKQEAYEPAALGRDKALSPESRALVESLFAAREGFKKTLLQRGRVEDLRNPGVAILFQMQRALETVKIFLDKLPSEGFMSTMITTALNYGRVFGE